MSCLTTKKEDLPFEVLSQIFENLFFTDQRACQTVCKARLKAASECANKELKFMLRLVVFVSS